VVLHAVLVVIISLTFDTFYSNNLHVVTEIPSVDEDTERELLSLLGDWYEPESIESLFSSMPSDAVFFSS